MPAVQTTYAANQPVAVAGMAAQMTGWDADSKFVETAAGIGFGLAVSRGSAENGCVIGGTDFIGVTLRDIALPVRSGSDVDKYLQKDLAGIMTRGDIWVTTEDAVAAGDVVEFNATTGQLGADGGTAVHDARWIKGAAAGGLALLRLGSAAQPKDNIA